jgi:8-oxo-dGTP diphosphatase
MKPHLRVGFVLLWRDGKIYVTRRRTDARHFAGVWEFPGGKCEEDETPERVPS